MPSRLSRLDEMGIEVYVRRDAPSSAPQPPAEAEHEDAASGVSSSAGVASGATPPASPDAETWRLLEQEVAGCTACGLHQTRTQTVFGVGDHGADWMFIGEGPGFEEDRKGEPFVGRAGKLLDRMLAAIGFDRTRVYIANTVKCRPPENRNPRPEELAACNGYLQRQIALVRPRVIVALGGVAANTLLQSEAPVGKLRGRVYRFGEAGVPLVVTYHPAYLLRAPQQKRAAWEDLQLAQRTVAGEAPA